MVIDVQPKLASQLWARTNCSNSTTTGKFSCQTGDCGTGSVDCSSYPENPVATLAEFTLESTPSNDFYDVSLLKGYNIPLSFEPKGGNGESCRITGCTFGDVRKTCPQVLQINGACQSPCSVFGTAEYCCNNSNKCQPTSFSNTFKKFCPRAYSYVLDDSTSTFSCGDTPPYTITFCPTSTSVVSELSRPLQSSPSPSPSSPLPSPALLPPLSLAPQTNTNSTGSSTKTKKHKSSHKSVIVAVTTSITLSLLLAFGIWICIKRRKAMKRHYAEMEEIKAMESLQFDINTIKVATRNFSTDNKLGEGGFGKVYKGKLESGQEIAVKRLIQNSKQGVAEFKTEVILVAKLQHKNLVKLLGFCFTSKEKILVYEFLPNSSLDRFLFDSASKPSLDWQKRLNIIIGIARGLMYLHEDSGLKVIHRDLKTSNILLDEAMNPKISDFGLAKLFGEGQTQGDTKRIVGTYGYMAPEYAITGHYSVKSDVYSFGVIVLEIISGKKNRFFGGLQFEESLLHRAWRLWNERTPLDLVDTRLQEDFRQEEALRCFHIGLLCIQEDAVQRPGMRLILDALNRPSITLPEPKPPRFFGDPNNLEGHHHSLPYSYTGTEIISDLVPRD